VAMGALLWLTAPILFAAGHDPHGPAFFLLVATLISGGVAAYAFFLLLLGVISRNDAIGALRKSASSRLRG